VLGRLFDERFKNAAAGIYAYAPVRLVLAAFIGAFVGLGVGWPAGAAWTAAAFTAELAMVLITRAVARAPAHSARRDWACAAVYLVAVPTWSMAGVLLWSSSSPACELAGAAFFAGHLLYMQSHHSHSLGAALPTVPGTILPAFVPLLIPHFHGVDQVIVFLTMVAVVGNALVSMFVSVKKSHDLQLAQIALRAASDAKSEFLARMSHEIRTPLNGVLGMAQAMAAASDLPTGHRQSLAVIRESGESLLAILNDVLDLSKVEAGRLELEEIPFDLVETVRGAQETFAPQAAAKGIAFRLEMASEAAGTYLGDPTRLRQILYNLLSNAVKFTEAGAVSLTVSQGAGALELVVADSGIGIAPADLARLFSRFQQVDSSTTRRYGGTGLGLSICRELAELMGGSVDVQSVAGEGSRFLVVLPLKRLGDTASASQGVDGLEAGVEGGGPPLRVLAAEDNPVNQLVLRTLLAQVGVEPVLVGDGQAAIEAWRADAYDLILMDMQMPVLDGISAARAIRAAEAAEGLARTPIVALTANAMQHQVAEYLAAGLDGHVAKPIDARKLYAAIAEAAAAVEDAESAAA